MRHNDVIYDDISRVIAPDVFGIAKYTYSSGESQWLVATKAGRVLSVPTRRVPVHLRWSHEKSHAYIDLLHVVTCRLHPTYKGVKPPTSQKRNCNCWAVYTQRERKKNAQRSSSR